MISCSIISRRSGSKTQRLSWVAEAQGINPLTEALTDLHTTTSSEITYNTRVLLDF